MDKPALAKLSEAFSKIGKPDSPIQPPVKKKRHRRRRRRGPITEAGRLHQAQDVLSKTLTLKSEAGSSVKRLATKLTVAPTGEAEWQVSGGQCQHTVIRQDSLLVCVDHSPAHLPPRDGFACSHETAVRRYLVQEILRREAAA